jgi:hypothetical protein
MNDDEMTATYGKAWAEARKLNEARKPDEKLGERSIHLAGLRAVAGAAWREAKTSNLSEGGAMALSPYRERLDTKQMWPNE